MQTTTRIAGFLLGLAIAHLLLPGSGSALSVSPTVVNIRAQGPTTVFLTYRRLDVPNTERFVPVEAFWCGELNPDNSCMAGTIFGRLPLSNELATMSRGGATFTEVVTFPSSVTRQAYQRARQGGPSRFFYVRKFREVFDMPGLEVFVPVLVRLASGGAGVPLSLMEVRLRWKKDKPLLAIPRGAPLPPFGAEIRYNGSGRLKGRWEIVSPGDSQPRMIDLLPEADLPLEERISQRRYTRIERFDRILPPTRKLYLPGPDPKKIPIHADGLHLILLRIEATQDQAGGSNIAEGDFPATVVQTGGTAGFPLPVLRFIVGSAADPALMAELTAGELKVLEPRDHAKIGPGDPLTFSWDESDDALIYKFVVQRDEKEEILTAMTNPGVMSYTAPPSLREHAGEKLRWRVEALGNEGIPIATSEWRDLRIEK